MSVTVADKFIDAGGIRFQYREAGDSGKVIVFLHGAGGQSPKSARAARMCPCHYLQKEHMHRVEAGESYSQEESPP